MASEINSALDTLLKIKELLKSTEEKRSPDNPRSGDESVKILEKSIGEHHRLYDHTSNIYDQLRIKALALIAGEVAIVTFLFSGWDMRKTLHDGDRVFFFFLAVLFLSLAFGLLLWIISTVSWKMPHTFDKASTILGDKNRNTYDTFIRWLHDDYTHVTSDCMRLVTSKCKKFNWTVYLLAAGVIILMVIKYGGPQ